jgi:hypothetical protein
MIQYCYDELAVQDIEMVWEMLQQRTPEFVKKLPILPFLARLREGYLQLWVEPNLHAPTAVMITEITGYGEQKTIRILAFAGKNPESASKGNRFEAIKQWAFKNGGTEIEAVCGDVQMRLFSRWGFVKKANVISLSLKDSTQAFH